MKKSITIKLSALLLLVLTGCSGQENQAIRKQIVPSGSHVKVGGAFENSDFMYIGMPDDINAIDTSAGWDQDGQKLLITGTIYKTDGKTPAPNVILYYYHTDINGYYSSGEALDERVGRHGYIRGWVKSDENGHYAIYTVRPAPYPNNSMPAHIHPAVKEPNINEYYLDELVFDDDKLLTGEKRKALENRGGSGILRVLMDGELQVAEHNIILGLNIPNYPYTPNDMQSGRSIGEDIISFTPFHAWGPDKGTKTCPICKYGRYHGILYFVGNLPNWKEIKSWLAFLENESIKGKKYLKVYFIYGNEVEYSKEKRIKELEELGKELDIKNVALTIVPSLSDKSSEIIFNEINPDVENTIILYRNRNIIDKYVNLKPTRKNMKLISQRLETTKNAYFNLPEPGH